MALIFIPPNDYSSNGTEAASITLIDYGYIRARDSQSQSFRIGNNGSEAVSFSLSCDDPAVTLSLSAGELSPGACTDTVTATVSLPLEVTSGTVNSPIQATTSTGAVTSLTAVYSPIGANTDRFSQYPERAGDRTDNFTGVLDRFAEPVEIHRFAPVAYSATIAADRDRRIRRVNGRFLSYADPCARLSPQHPEWGYVQTSETITAVFEGGQESTQHAFRQTDTAVEWTGTASLLIPADYELDREWSLFHPATQTDRAQYKRTVLLAKRQGDWWEVTTIHPQYYGDELAYWACELVPLQTANMGAPSFSNPFAVTYDGEGSDKPYAVYPCPCVLDLASEYL